MIAPLAGPVEFPSTRSRAAEAGRVHTGGIEQGQSRARGDSYEPGIHPGEEAERAGKAGDPAEKKPDGEKPASVAAPRGADGEPLTPAELQVISKLQARDREVRAHEAAHQAVGGSLAGGATFSYQTGPDGKRYAIGGEVSVDLSTSDDPRETIARMAQVRAAALAPGSPSAQDRAVAAAASAISAKAQMELAHLHREQLQAERPGSRFIAEA